MKRAEYLNRAFEALSSGRVIKEAYDAMIQNADIFCELEDDDEWGLPGTYAEIDYSSERFESDPEAIDGAKWNDMNYSHFIEK